MKQATSIIGACYGQPNATSMTEAGVNVWSSRIGRPGATRAPKLASLPPTTEAFTENMKRANLQTWIWKNALQSHPSSLDCTLYGYRKEKETMSLMPITVSPNV